MGVWFATKMFPSLRKKGTKYAQVMVWRIAEIWQMSPALPYRCPESHKNRPLHAEAQWAFGLRLKYSLHSEKKGTKYAQVSSIKGMINPLFCGS